MLLCRNPAGVAESFAAEAEGLEAARGHGGSPRNLTEKGSQSVWVVLPFALMCVVPLGIHPSFGAGVWLYFLVLRPLPRRLAVSRIS